MTLAEKEMEKEMELNVNMDRLSLVQFIILEPSFVIDDTGLTQGEYVMYQFKSWRRHIDFWRDRDSSRSDSRELAGEGGEKVGSSPLLRTIGE